MYKGPQKPDHVKQIKSLEDTVEVLERALADLSRTSRERDMEVARLSGSANGLEHYVFGLTRLLIGKDDVTVDSLNESMALLPQYVDLKDYFLRVPPPAQQKPAGPLLVEAPAEPSLAQTDGPDPEGTSPEAK